MGTGFALRSMKRLSGSLARYHKLDGGLPEALVELPDLARFYTGMSNLDGETSAAMTNSFNTAVLASRLSRLLSFYSSALAVSG